MKDLEEYVDLYTDYLISTNSQATATQLSSILNKAISHDKFTRMLKEEAFDSKYLWKKVKKMVRQIESENGCLVVDDTIVEKEYTDENDIVCWHYDHTKGRNVKGFNILNMLYYSSGISIPVSFEVIRKTQIYTDEHGNKKRKSEETKNILVRKMLLTTIHNQIPFRFVLMDSWFAAKENFEFIEKNGKHFIAALKSNRLFALSLEDLYNSRFQKVEEIKLKDKEALRGYLKGYDQEVLLVRRIFTNKDGSISTLDLVCSDTSLSGDEVATIYQKRWKVEEYHKSLKSNAAVAKSPTRRVTTQMSHIVMSMIAVFKLECLKIKYNLNHFALKTKLLLRANLIAMEELRRLRYKGGQREVA